MKRQIIGLTLILFILGLGVMTTAAYAKDNCSDCHHIDFEATKIIRRYACLTCHSGGHEGYPAGGVFTEYGYFKTAASPLITDVVTIHNKHNGMTPRNTTGCQNCHTAINCKTCHYNVSHTPHSTTTYPSPTYNYADGTKYYKTTNFFPEDKPQPMSCAISQCHKWYTDGVVYPSTQNRPLCLNCHTDPHGTYPQGNDDFGVQINPNSNPSLSDVSIKWLYSSGDQLKKSLDGLNWSSLDIGSPTPGSNYTYIDPGIKNWSIVYYKVIHSDNSEKFFPVYPPGSNAHTNYLENTDLCANCHVTHSGEQAKLLKEKTIEDLCRTCHGLTNTGSRYNVDTGEIVVAGSIDANGLITATAYARSNSGAFGIKSGGKLYAGNNPGTWDGAEVTSSHSTNSLGTYIAPGGGNNSIKLTCSSCHLSHPKKNSYRLLNTGTVEAYAVNPDAMGERVNYIKNMNIGCGCHQLFIAPENSGHSLSKGHYRHAVGVAIQGSTTTTNVTTGTPWSLTTTLPTEYKNNQGQTVGSLSGSAPAQYVENGAVFCLTCHFAHGSTAQGVSHSVYDLNGDSIPNDDSSMLKRKSYSGVCQDCHKK